MSSQIDKLITVAEGEAGYLEKKSNAQLDNKTANAGSNNYTKYGAWYGLNGPNAYWCAMFVSWCVWKAGISTDIIPKHASCAAGVNWFIHAGRWHARAGYTPAKGDIIYFAGSANGTSPAHVGIVYDVSGGKVYTIEGNTNGGSTVVSNGGGVAKKSYALTYNQILGYGHPAYVEDKPINQEEDEDMVKRYNTLSEMPAWAQATIKKLVDIGAIKGSGAAKDQNGVPTDMDFSEDMLRLLVVNDRAGLYK